ncbi:MAG: biotin-dependent carboxyltransferase family protein [Gammaproteobacteria bacterium]|nr:biotin-dependent carboxyltransferase family protein [Gammaproteobacteria bacterium]
MSITVLKPGLQTTIQSRPRTGLRHLGVPASGAADPLSLALANRLVGNDWDTPALEATLLGPTLRFDVPCAFAITGAEAAVTLNGGTVALHETVFAEAGDELATGSTERGARLYVAIAGGLAADDVLGSPSTCLLAAFGGLQGRALEKGDELRVTPVSVPKLQTPDEFRPPVPSSWALRACESLETHQLGADSRDQLFNTNWTVGRRADRMGLQLDGPTLEVSSDGRMPSAPVFPGTVQCPESGSPYVLSVDAGTVGGYPRIAQVARADRHLLGQLRPGDHVRLLWRDEQSAVDELRAKIDYWRAWLGDIEQAI